MENIVIGMRYVSKETSEEIVITDDLGTHFEYASEDGEFFGSIRKDFFWEEFKLR